jgi:cell wall-associated NlpC family hydrolase
MVFGICVFVMMVIILIFGGGSVSEDGAGQDGTLPPGTANVSKEVLRYEPLVSQYAAEFGVTDYVQVILAIMQQESGGAGLDPMQASESPANRKYCKQPNCITDPEYSIRAGVENFSIVIKQAKGDLPTALQSYNFGSGFIDYVRQHGGKYTKELALKFSQEHSYQTPGGCPDPNDYRGKVHACYGDYTYVDKVMRNLGGMDSYAVAASGEQIFDFNAVYGSMRGFLGLPYNFGGNSPQTGFDCSSLMQWNFKQAAGINLPRVAQDQYRVTARVKASDLKPGDLVFFTGTYDAGTPVTHVGMYIGGGKMINDNSSGVSIDSFTSGYWRSHLYGYGRIVRK